MPNWKKLIVSGSDASLNSLIVSTNTTSPSITGSLFGTASWASNALTSSNVLGGATSYIPLWNTATSLSSSVIYQSAGNIGIGTISPTQTLTVNRTSGDTGVRITSAAGGAQLILNSSNGYDRIFFGSSSEMMIGGWPHGGDMQFHTNSTERMRITAGGNVGIGTTSPSTRLHIGTKVNDDNTYTYDTGSLMVVHQTPTSTTTLNDPQEVLLLARQGTGGQAYGAAASFRLSRYENASVNSRTRLDIVLANDYFINSGQNRTVMTLQSAGNVGIGTTTPNARLEVSGSAIISGSLSVTQGITGSLFGTASWANNAVSSSFALSASWAPVAGTTVFPYTGSALFTGSILLTGSIVATETITARTSMVVTGSLNISNNVGSTQYTYGYLSTVSSSTNIISSVSTGSFRAAFYNYVATSGSNARAGQISSVWFLNTCSFAEYITTDIGTTSNLDMTVRISGSFVQLLATVNQPTWIIDTSVNLV